MFLMISSNGKVSFYTFKSSPGHVCIVPTPGHDLPEWVLGSASGPTHSTDLSLNRAGTEKRQVIKLKK